MPQIPQEESQMSTLFSVGNNICPSKIWNFKMLFGTQNEYKEYMGVLDKKLSNHVNQMGQLFVM